MSVQWVAVLLDGDRLVPMMVDGESFERVFSGLGRVHVEQHDDGRWYAAVYWTQIPSYAHQGTEPIRYAQGAFGATPWEAAATLRREMGLTLP